MQKPSQNNFTNRTIISEDFIFPHDYSQAFTMDESKAFSNSIQGTAVACHSFTCSINHQDEDLVCCPSSSSPAPSSAFCPSLLYFIDNNFPDYLHSSQARNQDFMWGGANEAKVDQTTEMYFLLSDPFI